MTGLLRSPLNSAFPCLTTALGRVGVFDLLASVDGLDRILRLLVRKFGCICGEIVEELPLAQSTVSQHLKVLKC